MIWRTRAARPAFSASCSAVRTYGVGDGAATTYLAGTAVSVEESATDRAAPELEPVQATRARASTTRGRTYGITHAPSRNDVASTRDPHQSHYTPPTCDFDRPANLRRRSSLSQVS